jgi:hypothetical protein
MESRQLIGIALGAALGAVLGAVLFEILTLGLGALGAGIGGRARCFPGRCLEYSSWGWSLGGGEASGRVDF